MTMVFDRYPEGGNERLLALAMADHARDDGTRIWPSVAELSRKTMQSERTVQRQIVRMVARRWLEVVRTASGRPGDTNEYRISQLWIDGGELPPFTGETGDRLSPVSDPSAPLDSVDNVIHTGDTIGETGDKSGETGDTAMSPESSGTIKNQYPPYPPLKRGDVDNKPSPKPDPGKPPSAKDRLRWRWADKRSTIEERGEQLAIAPWDERAFGMGGESFKAYAARVFASHLATQGVTTSPGVVREALDANDHWSEVLRQLAGENNKETP